MLNIFDLIPLFSTSLWHDILQPRAGPIRINHDLKQPIVTPCFACSEGRMGPNWSGYHGKWQKGLKVKHGCGGIASLGNAFNAYLLPSHKTINSFMDIKILQCNSVSYFSLCNLIYDSTHTRHKCPALILESFQFFWSLLKHVPAAITI